MTPAKRLIMMGARKYKNLIANGNFATDDNSDGLGDSWGNSTAGDQGNLSINLQIIGNTQRFESTGSYSGIQQQIITAVDNKYYIAGYVCIITAGTGGGKVQIRAYGFAENGSDVVTTIGVFQLASVVVRRISTGTPNIAIHNSSDGVGTIIQCKNILCVNLTAEFGAGNEPTLAWCDANIPQNIIW